MSQPRLSYFIFEVAGGFCGIAWHGGGIRRLCLPAESGGDVRHRLLRRSPGGTPGTPATELAETVEAVERYFSGESVDFSHCRLDLSDQEPLYRRIYESVRGVGWGQTTTYGAVAKELGVGPEAAREVGQAMARNPVPLIIPCHRVLAAGGHVGGFSAPGGAATKKRMLELEGVRFDGQASPQQSLF